jgi:L-amino acid N-acyltransferase YncA
MIHVRPAGTLDASAIADLLNEIIAIGGTTAMTDPVDRSDIAGRMTQGGDAAAWHVAEDDSGALLGFQWIAPNPDLPPDACDIATFVRIGRVGLGIGSRLFDATRKAARALGYRWINATIRADNGGGLIYYQSRGFEDYARREGVRLANGMVVDKVCKRYDL